MENDLIRWLRQRLPPHPLLRLGLGDDAAVLDLARSPQCAITVDLLSDGVDFVLDECDPARIGRKALAVNLSDLAAMAARPLAGVVALLLPRRGGLALAQAIYEGMLPLAEHYDLAIAGGDTNSWDGPMALSVTLLGAVTERGPLRRQGAKPGDVVFVSGALGGSILGRHFDFEPRVAEALRWHAAGEVHAGIDISDGLTLDLSRLCAESGVGAVLRAAAIPIHDDAVRLSEMRQDGQTPLDHALGDGEDFELILAVPPHEAVRLRSVDIGCPLVEVGRFVAEPGLWLEAVDGVIAPLEPRGFEHRLDEDSK